MRPFLFVCGAVLWFASAAYLAFSVAIFIMSLAWVQLLIGLGIFAVISGFMIALASKG